MGKMSKNKRYLLGSTAACLALICSNHTAHAFTYDFNNGVTVRFDNTLQYSAIERVSPELPVFANSANANDGDNNLRSGLVSNRFDLLSTFDISDSGYGFDASVDSFYDSVYNQKTQNTNGATYNPAQEPYNKFTSAVETQSGRNIEARNLFIYGSPTIGGIPFTIKVGRLVNLYGESLLFAANGISYGQAPLDVVRTLSVPNTQAKDLFLPVGQATISAQLSDSVSVSAYYEFEWEKFNFIPAGTYFSPADVIDQGGQRLYVAPFAPYVNSANPGLAGYFYRSRDLSGSDTGQFGAAAHWDPSGTAWDFGFYALQYNDSQPEVYIRPGAGAPAFVPGTAAGSPAALSLGTYQTVYANGIQTYGASASTTYGALNLAGEVSVRANDDLQSTVEVLPGQNAGNYEHNALYAIGDVAHYQVSEIYLGPKIPDLWDTSSVIGEFAGENLFAITKNKAAFSSKHMAMGLRTVASATYFQVIPGLDLSPNIGLGWNFMGHSPDTSAFNGTGIDRGGDLTIGVSATYLNKWTAGIHYTRFIAPPARDGFADRDYLAFNIERTF